MQPPPELGEALARSAVHVALALGFAPPDRGEVGDRLASREGSEALVGALTAAGFGGLAGAARQLAARPPDTDAYRRLFGHTARGAVPPYGAEYGSDTLFQQPQRLADIAGIFAAFGVRVDPAEHERVDHVRCQLEFLAFLARKEAYEIEHRESDRLEEIRKAERLFLREHLGRFAPAFGERLRQEDAGGFYDALGGLLRDFVEAECQRLGVAAGPDNLVLRPDADDGAPLMCGSGEECMATGPPASGAPGSSLPIVGPSASGGGCRNGGPPG
ncbi:MAG: molecular chaperone TorD family protein [Thermoanaerobaculia bacterium]